MQCRVYLSDSGDYGYEVKESTLFVQLSQVSRLSLFVYFTLYSRILCPVCKDAHYIGESCCSFERAV